jgi:hypothetical protein
MTLSVIFSFLSVYWWPGCTTVPEEAEDSCYKFFAVYYIFVFVVKYGRGRLDLSLKIPTNVRPRLTSRPLASRLLCSKGILISLSVLTL